MRKASWILLLVLGFAMLALSLVSAATAYTRNWVVGATSLARIEAATPGAGVALRGSRATAAAFAAAYWGLFLAVVLGPYRRGEAWAWWALLGSMLSLAAIILLRVPLLGTTVGASTAIVPLAVVFVSLLLDAGPVRASDR